MAMLEPVVDVLCDQQQLLAKNSARASKHYQDAVNETMGDVAALSSAYSRMLQGAFQLQHSYWDQVQQALAQSQSKPQDLFHCTSPEQLAKVQKDLYCDGLNFMVQTGTKLMACAGLATADTAQALRQAAH
jgi:hypothetical protein